MAKVLLVEDDNNLREIFEMRLQAEGYDTVIASDGEEALTVAMKERPDLIIADVMMPKLSGFEMLETLRAAPEMNNVKVIMMTALGQAEDRIRGEKLGVVRYLVKSQVTLEDFIRVVSEIMPVGKKPVVSAKTGGSGQTALQQTPSSQPSASASTDPGAIGAVQSQAMSSDQQQSTVSAQVSNFAAGVTPAPPTDIPPGDNPVQQPYEEGPMQTPPPTPPDSSMQTTIQPPATAKS